MKRPSMTSTQGGIVSHSSRSDQISQQYHQQVIKPVQVKQARYKRTRSEHQLNSNQDWDEKGHKL